MTFNDILEKVVFPLFSTFIGAFLAFRYQYKIEKRRDKRAVVQSLMMYRNVGADELDWIKALNVVDIVFHDEERVRQLFHKFLEYTTGDKIKTFEYIEIYNEMLYEMTQRSGYTQLLKSDIDKSYTPLALDVHYPNRYESLQRRHASSVEKRQSDLDIGKD